MPCASRIENNKKSRMSYILVLFEKYQFYQLIILHEAVKLESKTEFFNTKQNIFICIKGKRDLPIIQISEPMELNKIEEKATDLAYFLKVPVKF